MARGSTTALVATLLAGVPLSAALAFDSDKPPAEYLRATLSAPKPATRIVVDKRWRLMMLERKGEVLRVYSIGLGDDPVGHKEQQGDSRTPEGVYRIDFKHPNSRYHLALRISYPNNADRARARKLRVKPGSDIMIHGAPNRVEWWRSLLMDRDWTDGCVAVTNSEIEEIWSMVQVGTRVDIRP